MDVIGLTSIICTSSLPSSEDGRGARRVLFLLNDDCVARLSDALSLSGDSVTNSSSGGSSPLCLICTSSSLSAHDGRGARRVLFLLYADFVVRLSDVLSSSGDSVSKSSSGGSSWLFSKANSYTNWKPNN